MKCVLIVLLLVLSSSRCWRKREEGVETFATNVTISNNQEDLYWLEELREDEIDVSHRTDSLSMLILITLLIITVISAWLFKFRRFAWLHETGFSLLLGILVGGLIRLSLNAMAEQDKYTNMATVHLLNSNQLEVAPARLVMNISGRSYAYYLEGLVLSDYAHMSQYDDNIEQLEEKSSFNPEIFFYVLLPPIVFYAGYQLQRFYFFRNIGTILTLAFIGTTISFLTVGGIVYYYMVLSNPNKGFTLSQSMLFGAIISSTDPVTVLAIFNELKVEHDLYALVFGESVINDAVAIGLHRAVLTYIRYPQALNMPFNLWSLLEAVINFLSIFVGSFLIGTGVACITALITKLTKIGMSPLLETALILLMSYSTFLISEVANWSGIVAVLFCGIAQKHYTSNNLSVTTSERVTQLFELLNFLSESFIFSYIGLSVFLSIEHKWDVAFISVTFLALQVARALAIYPLCLILNFRRTPPVPCSYQHVLMWSGLRGAMAFALAIRNTATDARQMMLTATLSSVILSVMIQGGLTLPVVKLLKVKTNVKPESDDVVCDNKNQNFGILPKDHIGTGGQSSGPGTDAPLPVPDTNTTLTASNYPLDSNDGEVPQSDPRRSHTHCWLISFFHRMDQEYLIPFLTVKKP